MKQLEVHYCVVGAGISGLTAAYRRRRTGATVVVLEAGNRIGGRMYSAYLSDDKTPFEIGAEWISGDTLQPALRKLMRDLENDPVVKAAFPTFEQYTAGKTTFIDFNGDVYHYDALPSPDNPLGLPPVGDEAKGEIAAAFAALAYMSTLIDPKSRWLTQSFDPSLSLGVASTDDADRITLYNWLDKNFRQPATKALIAAMFRGTMGLDPEAISFLHCIFFLQTFGCNPANVLGAQKGQSQHLRLLNGVERIIDALGNAIGPEFIYSNQPVRDIECCDGHVIVRTEDVSVQASQVVVATSTAAVNFVRFTPPLPPDRAQLQQRMGLGSFWKIWLVYDKPFWRFEQLRDGSKGLSGAIICIKEDAYVATTLDSSLSDEGPGLMTCFIDAGRARALAILPPAERRQAIIQEMVRAFGPKAANLSQTIKFPAVPPQDLTQDSYFEWNWSLPDFIRGDYAAAPGPGVYTASGFGPALHDSVGGRVHWAGSDNGIECYGSVNGAVSSAERAVAEILRG
jgi:monoamine oxidase